MENPDDGRGDAVGHTVKAAITYGEKDFIDAFQRCFGVDGRGRWWGERHPDVDRDDLSRDHCVWWVLGLKYFSPSDLWMTLKMPWRISKKFTQSIDMWLWIRVLARGGWFWRFSHWLITGIFLRFALRCIQLAIKVGEFETKPYKEFRATPVSELTKRQRWGRKIMKVFPSYSVHSKAWQLTCLKDGWFKRRLQKLVIRMVEPTNYVVRSLCGHVLTDWEWVDANYFTGTDAYRWSRRLDESTTIDLFPLEGPQDNPYNMEVDILKIVMQGKHKLWLK